MVFINTFSKKTVSCLLKKKVEAPERIEQYFREENVDSVKILRSEGARELDTESTKLLAKNGIKTYLNTH